MAHSDEGRSLHPNGTITFLPSTAWFLFLTSRGQGTVWKWVGLPPVHCWCPAPWHTGQRAGLRRTSKSITLAAVHFPVARPGQQIGSGTVTSHWLVLTAKRLCSPLESMWSQHRDGLLSMQGMHWASHMRDTTTRLQQDSCFKPTEVRKEDWDSPPPHCSGDRLWWLPK